MAVHDTIQIYREECLHFRAPNARLEKLAGFSVSIALRGRLRIADFVFIPLWVLCAPVFVFGAFTVFGTDWRVLSVVLGYILSSVFYFRQLRSRLQAGPLSISAKTPVDTASAKLTPPRRGPGRRQAPRRSWWWRLTRLNYPIELLALVFVIAITLVGTIVGAVSGAP
jgi:hypothetical protein